jgi:hypothetical protein
MRPAHETVADQPDAQGFGHKLGVELDAPVFIVSLDIQVNGQPFKAKYAFYRRRNRKTR